MIPRPFSHRSFSSNTLGLGVHVSKDYVQMWFSNCSLSFPMGTFETPEMKKSELVYLLETIPAWGEGRVVSWNWETLCSVINLVKSRPQPLPVPSVN